MTSSSEAVGPLLELREVTRVFQSRRGLLRRRTEVPAVRNLSLTVQPAQIVALVGESGAGKSTVGRLALGLERIDAGEVRFDGTDLSNLSARQLREVRQRTHLVMQDPYQSLHPAMPVRELVAEPLAIAGVGREERTSRVVEALREVHLRPPEQFLGSYAHELSGGQRQRVAFARALAGSPRLIVADEPVSMLDVSLQAGILDLIFSMRSDYGIAFLFVTHDLAVARHIADRIAVMYRGQLVEHAASGDVVAYPQHPYTMALLAAVEALEPPPPAEGGLPPGGHRCDRHGSCDPGSSTCRSAEPVLVETRPAHFCACHLREVPERSAS